MARVFPGKDFEDVYNARNIYTSNIQGDDYKVRRSANDSNLDPRTNTEFQNKIIDAFSIASRIWKNKRECWKDHFRRGHKIFRYNELGAQTLEKDLSGYHLAMNILIQTLKTDKGEYYDPQCFCITPTDMFGEPLNTYSILDIMQHSKIDYSYQAKKLTFDVLQPEGQQYNRFRSAVDPNARTFTKCLLSSVGSISRDNCKANSNRDISLIKNIVQWPNIRFEPVDDSLHTGFGIWENDYFTYFKIPTEDLPITDGSMRGYQITLGYPFSGDSLCDLGNLQITYFTQYEKIAGIIQYSNNPPFYDVFYGNALLGRFGSGGGSLQTQILNFNDNFLDGSPNALSFNDYIYPVDAGYQPNMYPPGKLTECRLLSVEPVGNKVGRCQWEAIRQYWDAGTTIDFHHGDPTVLAKFNPWRISGCDDGSIFCRFPNGAIIYMYGSNDMQNWDVLMGLNQRWPFNSSATPICVGYSQYHFPYDVSYRYFMTYVSSTDFWLGGGKCGTLIGDTLCEPTPIDAECLGPAVGGRGLFFLEKLKPFEAKPVACRCPEFPCPGEFPLSGPNGCTLSNIKRCPDDPAKAIIGDTCVECVGAKPTGLVYDYLQ